MIAHLTGTLIQRRPDHVVLDVNGVGYRVFVTLSTYCALPEPGGRLSLETVTVVRDDAMLLYGFKQAAEKEAFGHLCTVKGVGPKMAMAILSGIAPDELWLAVRSRDAERLSKVPGIGKKTAARLVVELEGKLPEAGEAPEKKASSPLAEDAASALMNLGYPEAKARQAVDKVLKDLGPQAALEDVLKAALKSVK